jgi:cyclopropane fatty-acyl-phospholipid synthase-like methyltransferase
MIDTSSSQFFEQKYLETDDPWEFQGSTYEQARYEAILKALGSRRFAHAFEAGCSIGVLTEKLASRCERLTALDFSGAATEKARARCMHLPQVEIICAPVESQPSFAAFDLVLFSEIGYYFTRPALNALIGRIVDETHAGTLLLASHWLGTSPDHRLNGKEVQSAFEPSPWLTRLQTETRRDDAHAGFQLDLWRRN